MTTDLAPPAAYTDLDRMLAQERLDAIYTCLPPAVRGEAELKAMRCGTAGAGREVARARPVGRTQGVE